MIVVTASVPASNCFIVTESAILPSAVASVYVTVIPSTKFAEVTLQDGAVCVLTISVSVPADVDHAPFAVVFCVFPFMVIDEGDSVPSLALTNIRESELMLIVFAFAPAVPSFDLANENIISSKVPVVPSCLI